MTQRTFLLVSSLLAFACGDNKDRPDAKVYRDSSVDAQCSACPAAPVLGAQLDRMGRPAINAAVNRTFSSDSTLRDASKNSYNTDATPATWPSTWTSVFAQSLGILDVLDGGVCGNGLCESGEDASSCSADCAMGVTGAGIGCGNQGGYAGPASATSYNPLATILANDALTLDSSRGLCGVYLAVELGVVTGTGNTTCGGRTLEDDVVDVTYSLTALGLKGFSTDGQLTPQFGDMVAKHTDYLSEFPYLGPPH